LQVESIFADSSEMKDTSTLSGQELPGQYTLDNEEVNEIDKTTDANGDPSKDFDHTIDAENTTVDEPDPTLDSVEVNRVGEANDANGHPSQESDVTIGAENTNIDEPHIIHDSSKAIDANAEPTESIMLNIMMYPRILFKAPKKKLSVMMLRWEKQMRQLMLLVMLIKIVMIELMKKIPSLIREMIYLFKMVLK
jgi:hypothetical protein